MGVYVPSAAIATWLGLTNWSHIGDATDTPPLPPLYRYQMIEGVEVIAEVESAGGPTTEDPPGVPHVDIVTDLAVAVRGVHPFLFSASYNGELKIWR